MEVFGMSLMRWEPMGELESMRRAMDRMFEQVLGGGSLGRMGLPSLDLGRALMPNVEVYNTDKEVVVKAELPGIDPKDVMVEILEDQIALSGEMKKEEEIKEDNYYRSERQYGHFERTIPLPNRVKDAEAKATFKNGVLTIRAPLAEEVKKPQGRKLQIEE
jgi:HSP20 family protein